MFRAIVLFVTFLMPGIALASNATDNSNSAILMGNILSILLTLSLFLSLLFLLLTVLFFIKGLVDPQYSNKTGRLPVSSAGLIGGILACSLFASPLVLVDFIGNITGLTSSLGAPLCVAPNIDNIGVGYGWVNSSANCIQEMEQNFADLLNYSGQEAIETANLGQFLMAIQIVSVVGMLYGFVILMRHILGARDVKIGKGTAIGMIVVASTLFAIPNVVIFIDDAQDSAGQVV